MNKKIFIEFIQERFSLRTGKEAGTHTIQEATDGASIKGSNLWILLLAIIICSIGLNTNSPAIVIGAMLISPLMGPIIGIGVGLAIYDTTLIKKGVRNLIVAFILSLLVSSLYFYISPLTEPTKEIMARITPTIRDVIIAFSGGLVGAIALTRKEKSLTFIPGVAIATALMPPLCVTGYRLVQGNFLFALHSFYLLFINGVFIAGATFVISKLLHLPKTIYPTTERKNKIQVIIWSIVILTAIPSIIMTINILNTTIIEQSFNSMTNKLSQEHNIQIIEKDVNTNTKEIFLWFLGTYIEDTDIKTIKSKINSIDLFKSYTITIRQGIENDPQRTQKIISPLLSNALKSQEEQTIDLIKQSLDNFQNSIPPSTKQLLQELQIINDSIVSIEKGSYLINSSGAETYNSIVDSYTIITKNLIQLKEKAKISSWLHTRLQQQNLNITWKLQ